MPATRLAAAAAAIHLVASQAWAQSDAPPTVTVAPVEIVDVTRVGEQIGEVEAVEAVEIRARIEGFVLERGFEEGSDVTAGTVLYRIEPDIYEADVAAAEGQLASTQAMLRDRDLSLARTQTLVDRNAVSEAELDQAIAAQLMAAADVQVAEAALAQARLSLSYTEITAPIDGRVGVSAVSVGDLVAPDGTELVSVIQIDPIRVRFPVAESMFVETLQSFADTDVVEMAEVRELFIPRLRLANGADYPLQGTIDFIDNRVDPSTGTIAVRAVFPNPDGLLLPGAFVTVIVQEGEDRSMPVVPYVAVQEDRDGAYVLAVDADDRVQVVRIAVGENTGDGYAVTEGLSGGETVIVQGIQRVQPGIQVIPQGAPAEGE